VIRLVENPGGIVARDKLGAESLDGLSRTPVSSGRPLILIGTDKGSAVRWRFDVAHEIGHVLLHSRLQVSALRSEDLKLVERQAHRFAGAFLLPLDTFAEDCFAASLDVMRSLKPKWKVSIATMIVRCRDAGYALGER